jgi:hypothetical protein
MTPDSPAALPFSDVIPPELADDTRAVLDKLTLGKPLDPEARRRLSERAAEIRGAILRQHGPLDVGVPAIRALRDQ